MGEGIEQVDFKFLEVVYFIFVECESLSCCLQREKYIDVGFLRFFL